MIDILRICFSIPFLLLILATMPAADVYAQCDIALDEIDEFDSTRLVAARPIPIGYMVPSQFETVEGYMLIDEAQVMFTFTQNDSIDGIFLTLAVPEADYYRMENHRSVGLRLSNNDIIWLLNFPDKGTFDRSTNMRLYQHTCPIPLDQYYKLLYHDIARIRIAYPGYNHDITVLDKQQKQIREMLLCMGQQLGLFPQQP